MERTLRKSKTLVALLRDCAKNKDLHKGTKLHDDVVKCGLLLNCSDALVTMYAKCGALVKAQELFDMRKTRDIVTWNALIAGYAQKGQGQDALDWYEQMQCEGLSPDAVTFACILKACGNIKEAGKGQKIHDEIARQGLLEDNIVLGNALIDMYAKCGLLKNAEQVFEELLVRDVVSWNALMSGYVQQGQDGQTLNCLERMQHDAISPSSVTFICSLKACGNMRAADKGQHIHDEIVKQGLLGNDVVLGTSLVDMYSKCGALVEAQKVLEELPVRDVISWNALIAGHAEQGEGEQALKCLEQMQLDNVSPNAVTYICILKACGSLGAADKGSRFHNEIARQGLLRKNLMLANALVDMYAKSGDLRKAQQVLQELPMRDAVSWSALITGYAEKDQGEEALRCFQQMQSEGLSPNALIFTSILKACGSMGALAKGVEIHDRLRREGLLGKDIVLDTALVDMYAKCGVPGKAQEVLDEFPLRNVIAWNAVIAGYAQHGQCEHALSCFEQMQSEGHLPDDVTLVSILMACGSTGAAEKGEKMHDMISRQGLLKDNTMLGNALIDMYVKCGVMAKAQQVLEELPVRNVVSWSTLIAGYAKQGQGEEALDCLERMQCEGLCPNEVTYTCILKACGSIGAIDKGKQVHDEIARQGLLEDSVMLGTALVDMYTLCGALDKAWQVLEKFSNRDDVCWSAIIAGYALQGHCKRMFDCFEQMQNEGLSPNAPTFSSMLSSCSQLGRVEDAQAYFTSISTKHGTSPVLEHYTCMVDLFGRAGHLDRAVGVVEKMPFYDSAVWSALLGACHKWGDVNVARWAFERAVRDERTDVTPYLLMASIYAAAGMTEDADKIEAMRIENKAWKKANMEILEGY